MTDRCLGRRTKLEYYYFARLPRVRIHPELRCSNNALPGERLCQVCIVRDGIYDVQPDGTKKPIVRSQPGFPHGIVGEEYPDCGQIYGSPWYYRNAELYGEPDAESLKKLEGYRQEIMKGLPAVVAPAPTTAQLTQQPQEQKPKRKPPVLKQKKEKEKKEPVKQTLITVPTPTANPIVQEIPIQFAETSDDPIQIESVGTLTLVPMMKQGVRVWFCEDLDAHYEYKGESEKGPMLVEGDS